MASRRAKWIFQGMKRKDLRKETWAALFPSAFMPIITKHKEMLRQFHCSSLMASTEGSEHPQQLLPMLIEIQDMPARRMGASIARWTELRNMGASR